AGSLPDGQGPPPTNPPPVPPTLLLGPAIANPATLLANGLTNPRGAVFMGTHVWIVDPTLGFCKVNPTPTVPTLTACAVLPAGFVPGPPAFDKAGNRVYIPDTTAAGAGIVRLTFTPATEVVGTSTTVVTSAQLTAADPLATAP